MRVIEQICLAPMSYPCIVQGLYLLILLTFNTTFRNFEMIENTATRTYDNISQRAVDAYRRALRPLDPNADESPHQLHGFFTALYDLMFADPKLFGMSVADDIPCDEHSHGKDTWDDALRALKQPLNRIDTTVELLRGFAKCGQLSDDCLMLPIAAYREIVPLKKRTIKQCMTGLCEAGLVIREQDGIAVVSAPQFPQMMPALCKLAVEAESATEHKYGLAHFAGCRFNANPDEYTPDELFAYLDPERRARLSSLDVMLRTLGCSVEATREKTHQWQIKYMPSRKIKSNTLIGIHFDIRYRTGYVITIKPAATNRLMPHLAGAPKSVQAHYPKQFHYCNPDCTWCETKKWLGPSQYDDGNTTRSVCWFTRSSFSELSDEKMELVCDYVRWHGELA
jgi:hypothetical protein